MWRSLRAPRLPDIVITASPVYPVAKRTEVKVGWSHIGGQNEIDDLEEFALEVKRGKHQLFRRKASAFADLCFVTDDAFAAIVGRFDFRVRDKDEQFVQVVCQFTLKKKEGYDRIGGGWIAGLDGGEKRGVLRGCGAGRAAGAGVRRCGARCRLRSPTRGPFTPICGSPRPSAGSTSKSSRSWPSNAPSCFR